MASEAQTRVRTRVQELIKQTDLFIDCAVNNVILPCKRCSLIGNVDINSSSVAFFKMVSKYEQTPNVYFFLEFSLCKPSPGETLDYLKKQTILQDAGRERLVSCANRANHRKLAKFLSLARVQ